MLLFILFSSTACAPTRQWKEKGVVFYSEYCDFPGFDFAETALDSPYICRILCIYEKYVCLSFKIVFLYLIIPFLQTFRNCTHYAHSQSNGGMCYLKHIKLFQLPIPHPGGNAVCGFIPSRIATSSEYSAEKSIGTASSSGDFISIE